MAHASIPDARMFYAGDDSTDEEIEPVVTIASQVIAYRSKDPDDATPEYADAARAAELLVGRWIWRTDGGSITSKSISSVISKSYANMEVVMRLAESGLGDYYKDPSRTVFTNFSMAVVPGAREAAYLASQRNGG